MPYVELNPDDAAAAPSTTIGQPVPNNGMTLAYMDGEVEARLLGRTDVGEARRRTHINMAYTDLTTSLKIEATQASLQTDVVADQFLYRVPPCVFSILDCALIDDNEDPSFGGKPLDQTDIEVFRGRPQRSGTPIEFFQFRDMIVLWPTPDVAGTLVFDFRIRPDWLTQDTQCPILPIEFQEAILLSATSKIFAALQETIRAATANNDYVNFIRKRLDEAKLQQEQMIVRSSVPRVTENIRRTRTKFFSSWPWPRRH